MKTLFYAFLTLLLVSTYSCKKSADATNASKVDITVQDNAGAAISNMTVYMIDDNTYNAFGNDPFYKEQQSVTPASGVASFSIDDIHFTNQNQKTYYFFSKYTINGTSKTKSVGVTLSKGEKKTATLVLN